MAEVAIWIVNVEHWPRALLRAELIERGYDATGFVKLEDAIARLMLPHAQRPALLVLDAREQVVDEPRAALLARAGIPVMTVADLSHAGGASLDFAAAIVRRPVTIGAIADAVDRLTGTRRVR